MAKSSDKSKDNKSDAISGYGAGGVETVISVEEVTRQVAAIAEEVSQDKLDDLVGTDPYVTIDNLHAGYGKMEILHDVSLPFYRNEIVRKRFVIKGERNTRIAQNISTFDRIPHGGKEDVLFFKVTPDRYTMWSTIFSDRG